MSLYSEILEQPEVLRHLLSKKADDARRIAQAIRERDVAFVYVGARGTSDHAGIYAKYLWGAFNRLPVALAAPSLISIYARPPHLERSLVLGISQSGQSEDIVSVVREGGYQGALTVAITNDADSPLAREADHVVAIGAGVEKAVAATKTYTAELMALAMISAALNEDQVQWEALRQVPALVGEALKLNQDVKQAAERYRRISRCVILGRGYNYATVYEWALKLKELTYVVAEPYSSADFRHGPIAVVDRGFPVMAVAPGGQTFDGLLTLIRELRNKQEADLVVISNRAEALELANTPIRLPMDMPEWLSPLPSIVPAQLFTYYLAQARGLDSEAPRGLRKVTSTL